MSKRELKSLGVESLEKRTGLRTLSGRERTRKTLESSGKMMDAEAVKVLRAKVAELEGKLIEAL